MKFKQFYSSSKGSLYTLTSDNGSRLLIDPGVTWKKLQTALNYDLSNIVGALCSHGGHRDHSMAIRGVTEAGIDVYANEHTFQHHDLVGHRRAKVVADKSFVRLEAFHIRCFELHHDVPTLGFVIKETATNEYLLFAIDSSHITQRFKVPFHIIALECSFDKDILTERVETNDINETLAKRLLSSHMEKSNTLRYLTEFCDLSKCREIHLLHMSADNIDREKTRKEFEEKLFIDVVIV